MSRVRRGVLAIIVALVLFWAFPRVVPHASLRARVPTSTAVYDAGGRLLRLTLAPDGQYRVWVPLERISPLLIDATLLQEDRHFRWHPGVDPTALVRAAWHSYVSRDRREGGSTLTMQLARILYGIQSSSLSGKIDQIAHAFWLELRYTKREILEAYLNVAPYGGNIQGASAASLIYFEKDPGRLTLAEALTLAVLPQNPVRRGPGAGPLAQTTLRIARDDLYSRWRQHHAAAPGEAEALRLPARIASPADLPFGAPHFVNTVLAQDAGSSEIKTTLDRHLQNLLERQVRGYVAGQARLGVHNAAAMIVDSRTMTVRALVGSADFFNAGIEGQVNGTQAKRSPGSTLKPFIYGLGIDQGVIHPMTVLKDAPSAFGAYSPENFDGRFVGPLTAQDALIRSRNIPAVYVASQLSKPDLYDVLSMAGVSGLQAKQHYGLALVLGGGELTMEELVSLYGALSNEGVVQPVRYRVDQPEGRGVPVLSPEAAWVTLDMLKANPRPDAPVAATPARLPVYWKTGTSYGFRDAWTVGIFGPYVLAVWVGNFDGQGNPAFVGVQMAAPLFFRVVDAVEALEPSLGEPPRTFPSHLTRVDVCAASGDLPNAECPRTVRTWFIPGKSPIRVSTLHQALLIDDRTGLRDCPPYTAGTAHRVIYEMWSSDMARLFQEAGLPRRTPPPFDPRCETHVADNSAGIPPQITSPLRGVTYSLRARRLGAETITLRATASGGVHAVYWFVGSSFIGTSAPGATVGWRPDVAGSFVVRAVDDQGQADSRMVEVAIVP
ncbi:MAG TPA: penicillin-binding protein 1C [Gemmatimonadales bacterium]|nr:penicillin-binding protein 1C [Gemmatimonadales bacterium]